MLTNYSKILREENDIVARNAETSQTIEGRGVFKGCLGPSLMNRRKEDYVEVDEGRRERIIHRIKFEICSRNPDKTNILN